MLLDEVGAHLQTNGLGTVGTDLFLSLLPDAPDDALALYEYGGEAPIRVRGRRLPPVELPRFQVLSRSKSYRRAREKAEAAYRSLDGFSGELEGVGYGRISALQSPFFLSRDDAGRARIVVNFRAIKEPSPLGQPP